MISVKAIIFDMDGVIVDNQQYHLKAWEVFCGKQGFAFDIKTFSQKFFGKSNFEILNSLSPVELSMEETLKLGEEKEVIYRDLYINEIVPLNGLIAFLKKIKASDKRVAIASSAPISNINFVLDNLQIRQYFEAIVDVSMVKRSKPDPEIYLKAASLLNTKPSDCLVFEDSHSGIKAALAAGMNVIAITTTHTSEELNYNLLKVNNFEELTFN